MDQQKQQIWRKIKVQTTRKLGQQEYIVKASQETEEKQQLIKDHSLGRHKYNIAYINIVCCICVLHWAVVEFCDLESTVTNQISCSQLVFYYYYCYFTLYQELLIFVIQNAL
eukprot:TRINITY_DN6496_c1_g2_i1.p1 TRINITY_DN6496_c1_g2~~TRINITY_DN6496_c1_g2_i1.p1  ORF type:complete len:112 (-),score=3.20 TRINITY_DN6496_c1_g2_i1:177-512(-)